MKKNLIVVFALAVSFGMAVSCSHQVEPIESGEDNVKRVETLQNLFKDDLKSTILTMSSNAQKLLSSVVFDSEKSSEIVSQGGLLTSNDTLDDDAVFDTLSDVEKAKIQQMADAYFENVKNIAKSITVFDKGLPQGVYETDDSIEYAGIQYSKCVPETLKIAYQIRDELYNGNKDKTLVKGARLWVTPRWHLIGAPLGAIFYSYDSAFTREEKEAIRYAMDEWEEATDGAVKFYEKPLNWWGRIKWHIGICRNIRISKVINKNYSGKAVPGNLPHSYMYLNVDQILTQYDTKNYKKGWKDENSWTHHVLIHELGHTICLQHEFERADRNFYIEKIWDKMPGSSGFWRKLQHASMIQYGSYDYKSCMNYALPMHNFYKIKDTNRCITFDDIKNISHNDVLTVKYIYSKISYKEMIDNWQDTRSILLGGTV